MTFDKEAYLESFPLLDGLDSLIIMHRDAHFSGDFKSMYEYYELEGKGCHPDITLQQIEKLQFIEKETRQNIALLLLQDTEIEKIAKVKEAYHQLAKLTDTEDSQKSPIAKMIAELILSEEEMPQEEIDALVEMDEAAIPFLIDLIKSEDFYDPLFPGYGLAPHLAAYTLGKIGSKKGIIPLFESIGKDNFQFEESALNALKTIGPKAEEFLCQIISSTHITQDHEKAAIALSHFTDSTKVIRTLIDALKNTQILKRPEICTHIILALKDVQDPSLQQAILEIAKSKEYPEILEPDFTYISQQFKK